MQDPGSSLIQEELLSTLYGDTQFSIEVGEVKEGLTYETLFFHFKKHCDATILGVAQGRTGDGLDLNPPLDTIVKAGNIVHYIAVERVLQKEIDWQTL